MFQVLVLSETVEEVQEDHWRDCLCWGDQGEEPSQDQELWCLVEVIVSSVIWPLLHISGTTPGLEHTTCTASTEIWPSTLPSHRYQLYSEVYNSLGMVTYVFYQRASQCYRDMGARHRARAHAIQVNFTIFAIFAKPILTLWLSDHPVRGCPGWQVQKATGHPDAWQQDQVPSALQSFQAGWRPHPGQPAKHLLWVEELLLSCCFMSTC